MYTAGYSLSVRSWSFSGLTWRALFAEKVLKRGRWQRCDLWRDEPQLWSDTLPCGRYHQMTTADILGPHKPKHTTSRTNLNIILCLRRKRRITSVVPLEPVVLVDLWTLNVHLKATCMHINAPFLQPLGWWRTQAAYKLLNIWWHSCLCVISLHSFSKS